MQSAADLCSTRLIIRPALPCSGLGMHKVSLEAMLLSAVRGAREWQQKIKVHGYAALQPRNKLWS